MTLPKLGVNSLYTNCLAIPVISMSANCKGDKHFTVLYATQPEAYLYRKLILCALGTSNPAKAREIHGQMSESNRVDPSTQYLLYKLALKCKDQQLGSARFRMEGFWYWIWAAIECLDSISLLSTKDANVLYACVLEAQRTGEHLLTVTSLQRVLTKYDYGAPNTIHLPALLRYIPTILRWASFT